MFRGVILTSENECKHSYGDLTSLETRGTSPASAASEVSNDSVVSRYVKTTYECLQTFSGVKITPMGTFPQKIFFDFLTPWGTKAKNRKKSKNLFFSNFLPFVRYKFSSLCLKKT